MLADWPVMQTADFAAAYVFDQNGISQVAGGSRGAPSQDPPDSALSLWRSLEAVQNATTMVAQTGNGCTLVSRHGNMIVQGKAGLNLGLVFASLSRLAVKDPGPLVLTGLAFAQQDLQVFWRIINAIGRCEIPRLIVLDIGGDITTVCAGPDGFALTGGAQDVDSLVGSVRTALRAGQPVRYTLGDLAQPVAANLGLRDLLGAINGPVSTGSQGWACNAQGWPVSFPEAFTLEELNRTVAVAQALLAHLPAQGNLHVTLYGSNRQVVTSWQASQDGVAQSGLKRL